jgi:hypothetical protein
MRYTITETKILDVRSRFSVVETAALLSNFDPKFIEKDMYGEFRVTRDWDYTCEKARLVRTTSFQTEGYLNTGSPEQVEHYSLASTQFTQWMDALYEAIESEELPATVAPKTNPSEPQLRNLPQYTRADKFDPVDTKIRRTDIVEWLTAKGICESYFIKAEPVRMMEKPGYLDENHPSYSWRLQAAIEAWEHVAELDLKTAVKPEVQKWIDAQVAAGRFKGYSERASEAIQQVVNFNRQGGAPKTPCPSPRSKLHPPGVRSYIRECR